MIKKVAVTAFVSAVTAFAATWTGQISDSACGMTHAKMMTEHKDLKTDRDCTLACIAAGGKYVFVSDGKVYNIANQKLAALKQRAGSTVTVTGTMKGDTIGFQDREEIAPTTSPKRRADICRSKPK